MTGQVIEFTVHGKPQPAGSKRAFIVQAVICRACGYKLRDDQKGLQSCPKCSQPRPRPQAVVSDANPESKSWQKQVADSARAAYRGPLLDDYLRVTFVFFRPRPKGHFNSKNELNAKGEREFLPGTKPDVLKLARGAEDALTGIVWRDDALICKEIIEKEWGEPSRLEIRIEVLQAPGGGGLLS